LETRPPLDPGGCPRCGVRLAHAFKYCPNCAYRLRPEMVPSTPSREARTPLSTRLVALGGYLAFASMLLLVLYAGFALFREPATGPATQPRVILTRDPNCLPLDAKSFLRVDSGQALYGVHIPKEGRSPEILPEIFRVDDAFDLCIHEVTNDQYYEFLLDRARKSGRPVREWLIPDGWTRSTGKPEVSRIYDRRAGNLPVMEVLYQAALEFCAWYWEEKLKDPDYIVDLPTPLEYLLAARGDDYRNNFPWGPRINQLGARARLDKDPLPVTDREVGRYYGFFALVGNAAEWVHGYVPDRVPMAAGWSHLNALYRGLERRSPFGDDGFVLVSKGGPRPDLGFRILIRSAPAWPEFRNVEPGKTHHVPFQSDRLRPPPLFDEDGIPRGKAGAVTFATTTRTVARAFEISRSEITNRQYLHFLRAISPRKTSAEMEALIPSAWNRPNPWHWTREDRVLQTESWEDTVYLGPYGSPWKVPRVYEAGRENHPVEGVSLGQAKAYAQWLSSRFSKRCRLPTVGEFLRAGRGSGREPYPWGDDDSSPLLVCARVADAEDLPEVEDLPDGEGVPEDESLFADTPEDEVVGQQEERTVSLLGRYGERAPPLVGLVGNLPEYVWDPDWQDPDPGRPPGRWLLAGGCYRFPPELCTLDSFLDATWEYVEFDLGAGEEAGEQILNPLRFYAGFRLVREAGLF
jgi:formylglycine-generating enzyme required for sulfatase activity